MNRDGDDLKVKIDMPSTIDRVSVSIPIDIQEQRKNVHLGSH